MFIRIRRKEIRNKLKEVSKENRKEQTEFECRLCGKKLNADVNVSRNLLVCHQEGMYLRNIKQVFRWQIKRFLNLLFEWYKCLWGKAPGLTWL